MNRTNIYLDPGQIRMLDQLAVERGISRAELIRRLLDGALTGGGGSDLASDLEAIEVSFGSVRDLEVVDRRPDTRSRHLDRIRRIRA
jgi:hypothetical protein